MTKKLLRNQWITSLTRKGESMSFEGIENNDFWLNLEISPLEIKYMYHAIGLDEARPKRGIYRMTRNYFEAGNGDIITWEKLCIKCLAIHTSGTSYRVSGTGIQLIEQLLCCKIKG